MPLLLTREISTAVAAKPSVGRVAAKESSITAAIARIVRGRQAA